MAGADGRQALRLAAVCWQTTAQAARFVREAGRQAGRPTLRCTCSTALSHCMLGRR